MYGLMRGVVAKCSSLPAGSSSSRSIRPLEATCQCSGAVTNNTVYQPVGDAVRAQQGEANLSVRNNILWVQAGYDLNIASDSQQGFASDYNDLYATGAGKAANWQGQDYATRTDWFRALGFDAHGQAADPRFVNPAGPDGVLGYSTASADGTDDNFRLASGEVGNDHRHAKQLFLEERNSQRSFQHRLQRRMRIRHLLAPLPPLQIRVHHFADDRPRPDDRHLHHNVVEAHRMQPRQAAHLRAAFYLEHSNGVGFLQRGIDAGVVRRKLRQVYCLPIILPDDGE